MVPPSKLMEEDSNSCPAGMHIVHALTSVQSLCNFLEAVESPYTCQITQKRGRKWPLIRGGLG
ncbi:hypothetical protein BKA93DRAFT_807409 [Sparassis latifolia]